MKTYAPFFEWHEKGRKELGVVEQLIEALQQGAGLALHDPKEFTPDPPDCVCRNAAGESIAIEVAEVVCEEATRLNAQGQAVMRNWRPGELTEHVALVLTAKDGKRFHGGPYREVLACLFTDEPLLTVVQARAELAGRTFGPFGQLTRAFLLFSFESGSYPLVELALHGMAPNPSIERTD